MKRENLGHVTTAVVAACQVDDNLDDRAVDSLMLAGARPDLIDQDVFA